MSSLNNFIDVHFILLLHVVWCSLFHWATSTLRYCICNIQYYERLICQYYLVPQEILTVWVPFFILQTLNLIRFYLISPGFKYTFMPNLATTWEVREKGIWNTSTGTTLGCSLKVSVQGPTVLHMLSTKQTRCERNFVFNVTFGCTFTCHNYKGATLRANI